MSVLLPMNSKILGTHMSVLHFLDSFFFCKGGFSDINETPINKLQCLFECSTLFWVLTIYAMVLQKWHYRRSPSRLKNTGFLYLEAALMEYFLEAVSSSIRKRILKSYSDCNFFFRIFEHCEKWLLCY